PGEEDVLPLVEMAYEALDAALEVERDLTPVAVVDKREPDPLGQVGVFAKAYEEDIEIEIDVAKDVLVGQEGARSARDGCRIGAGSLVPGLLDFAHGR